jgi:predicted DNA-binding transcriptional regulator AlpA
MNQQQQQAGQHEHKAARGEEMTPRAKTSGQKEQPATLPTVGMSRWDTLSHFVPISRESWRKLVNAGKAPKPVKLSERCTMYPNAEVHRWLADPTGYQV